MSTGPQSNLSAPAGYSSSDLVFNDNFSGTSLDQNWNPYITSNAAGGYAWNSNGSGGSNEGGSYVADYDLPSQISVDNGLTLTATRQSTNGYPFTGAAVSSYGHFEFTGGYLQISMQQPSGDGAWPALWLLPGQGAGKSRDNFEIDMQEGGFTNGSNPNDNVGWHLHTSGGTFGSVSNVGTNLSSGLHTYGIDWEPGKSITWYVDGKEVGQVTSAQTTIPDEPMELIMNSSVANSNTAGWHTAYDSSTPSSLPMKVTDVQLYQHAGGGDTVMGSNVVASGGTTTTGTSTSDGGTSGTTTGSASGTGTTATDPTGTSGSSTTSTSGGTPTSGEGGTTSNTPTAPTVTVANSSLHVSPGGHVPLGVDVSVPNAGDNVTVNISGMPTYETITDSLDHKTFSGSSVTLTASEVDSGLTLNSSYKGRGRPTSTLTVTATDNTGTQISSAPQTIAVVDPSATTVSGTGSTHGSGRRGSSRWGSGAAHHGRPTTSQGPSVTSTASAGVPKTSSTTAVTSPTTPASSDQSSQHGQFDLAQRFEHHPGFAPVATTLSEAGASGWGTGFAAPVAAAPVGSASGRTFALFNQMMAGNFGETSHFAQATTTSSPASPQATGFLARPLH
ncbi:MAG: family 16 glycosylhydrolase [Bradyrhizobium sp.]